MKSISTEQSMWIVSVTFFCLWCISLLAGLQGLAYYLSIPIFFFFIGRSIRIGLLDRFGLAKFSGNYLEETLIDIVISSIVTIGVGGILATLYLLTALNTLLVNGLLFGGFTFLWLIRILKDNISIEEETESPKLGLDHKLGLLVIIIFSGVFVIVRWFMFPYPMTSGTDTFSHLAVINQIIHDNGSSHITSGGLYLYHAIVAQFCIISGANPLWVISNIYPIVYPVSMVLMYQFLFYISKNSKMSVIATIGTLSVYEHGGLLATYYPFTITFAFVLLYLCFIACYILEPSWFNLGLIITLASIAILAYFYAAFVLIPILAYLLVRQGFVPKHLSVLYKILFGGIIIGGGALIVTFYFIFPSLLGSTPEIEIAAFFTFEDTLAISLSHFTTGYSIWQAILMIVGLALSWSVVFSKRKIDHPWLTDFNFEILALLGTAYLIVFFTPISYAFRTELFVRAINLLLIVTSIFIIAAFTIIVFSYLIEKIKAVPGKKLVQNTVTLCFVMLLIFVPVSYEKTNRQITYLWYGETRTPTSDEMDAFNWIANNTVPGDYILTDMATGFILRGVIFRNASTSFTLDGRIKSTNSYQNLSMALFKFMNCTLHFVVDNYINLLEDETLTKYTSSIAYIMISPRTNYWLSQAREGIFRRTASYSYEINQADPSWRKFDSSYFNVCYSVGGVRILQLDPKYLL